MGGLIQDVLGGTQKAKLTKPEKQLGPLKADDNAGDGLGIQAGPAEGLDGLLGAEAKAAGKPEALAGLTDGEDPVDMVEENEEVDTLTDIDSNREGQEADGGSGTDMYSMLFDKIEEVGNKVERGMQDVAMTPVSGDAAEGEADEADPEKGNDDEPGEGEFGMGTLQKKQMLLQKDQSVLEIFKGIANKLTKAQEKIGQELQKE